MQDCIDHGVLDEFLRRHRAEVTEMILTGYDYEIHKANEKKLAYQEGEKQGKKQGEKQGEKQGGIRTMIRIYRRQNMPEPEILAEVMKEFSLDQDEARQYMDD